MTSSYCHVPSLDLKDATSIILRHEYDLTMAFNRGSKLRFEWVSMCRPRFPCGMSLLYVWSSTPFITHINQTFVSGSYSSEISHDFNVNNESNPLSLYSQTTRLASAEPSPECRHQYDTDVSWRLDKHNLNTENAFVISFTRVCYIYHLNIRNLSNMKTTRRVIESSR